MYIYYSQRSDRVTETCEACNLGDSYGNPFIIWRIMVDKPYTTYDQQIDLLEKKGLTVPDRALAIRLLKENGYYALVSGYKAPFKKKDKQYKLHTRLEDIYALYCFDMKLRALFLEYILKIENHIKSLLSYSFCDAYGDQQQSYLSESNYDFLPDNQTEIRKLIQKLSDLVNNPKQYPYLDHQKKNHNNIPLWALSKALTLGTISKFYSFLKQPIKQAISKEFRYVDESQLERMIDLLSRFRNVCAHNERLYDYRYNKGAIHDTDIHIMMNLKRRKSVFAQGKNDLFAVVIVFKYLLTDSDFSDFIILLNNLIRGISVKPRIIQESQLLKMMGFPADWNRITDLPYEISELNPDGLSEKSTAEVE